MEKLFFILFIFCTLQANAQNYQITFTGTGATTTVSTVKVENLSKSTSLTINGSDILHLTTATGVNSVEDNQSSELKIYPNPMADNSTLEILPPVAGNAVITVIDMAGKPVVQIQSYLESYLQKFLLSGIKNGFYLINVKGNNYQYSGKLLSNGNSKGALSIEKINSNIQSVDEKAEKANRKGTHATVNMTYATGDRLKFTGISGNYGTVITDIPVEDKTINFNFIACFDGDNNNYPVVAIGAQIWMAENLKTTKYNDGSAIPNITVYATWAAATTGAYCDFSNIPAYSTTYGRLYNWYAVDINAATKVASNGGKNVCPTSWHVPSDTEWTTLLTYLGGESIAGGKLKETGTTHWYSPNSGATNESGFTALGSGYREESGFFNDSYWGQGYNGYWWSVTQANAINAWFHSVTYSNSHVFSEHRPNRFGFSVRCLRDL